MTTKYKTNTHQGYVQYMRKYRNEHRSQIRKIARKSERKYYYRHRKADNYD